MKLESLGRLNGFTQKRAIQLFDAQLTGNILSIVKQKQLQSYGRLILIQVAGKKLRRLSKKKP